jgi:hypothetical protein
MDSVDPISKLRDMRDSIDNIDAAIILMLAERFRCDTPYFWHGSTEKNPKSEVLGSDNVLAENF